MDGYCEAGRHTADRTRSFYCCEDCRDILYLARNRAGGTAADGTVTVTVTERPVAVIPLLWTGIVPLLAVITMLIVLGIRLAA